MASFDKAVVTVPLGVLKAGRIVFQGENREGLSQEKIDAIHALGMGTLSRTWVVFKGGTAKKWWNKNIIKGLSDSWRFAPIEDGGKMYYWYIVPRSRALLLFMSGDEGREQE